MFATCLIPFTAIKAEQLQGCAAKKHNIERQLQYAKQAGNTYQIQGLERALEKTTTYCNDKNLNNQQLKKIAEKERKVEKRQQELNQAQAKNDLKKITKSQKKLAEAQAELKEAKRNLNR
ncbi:hypothetical protein B9T31_01340 [Acinetobacter sp. ANC 4558]|nr:hypothetical protein B9T31_01340 [Acinetobacter sp. ANC 4558]